jgi:hypothetical protein
MARWDDIAITFMRVRNDPVRTRKIAENCHFLAIGLFSMSPGNPI